MWKCAENHDVDKIGVTGYNHYIHKWAYFTLDFKESEVCRASYT
jgi:hypothetical protein